MGAYQRGAYQLFAYQIAANPTYTTTLMPGGPAYTRKRHRELLEAERAAERAERKARELHNAKERQAALIAAQEARRLVLEARDREAEQWANTHRITALHHALDAFNGARTLAQTNESIRQIHHAVMAAHANAMMDDDDEATALLLLH